MELLGTIYVAVNILISIILAVILLICVAIIAVNIIMISFYLIKRLRHIIDSNKFVCRKFVCRLADFALAPSIWAWEKIDDEDK